MPRPHLEVAKEWLTKWLAARDVWWRCVEWKGNDAARLEMVEERSGPVTLHRLVRPTVYREGDPRFFSVATINFEGNEASGGGAEARGIEVSRADVLAQIALLPKPPSARKEVAKSGPQERRVLQSLKKLYPPDGKVPDSVPTKTVRARVTADLAADSKLRGLADPSWDTVNRALDRAK